VKLGRKQRKYNPGIPHMSALLGGRTPVFPPSVDYSAKLPADLGMMLNDQLGDCTCAGVFHAIQVWTGNANPPVDTEHDSVVESIYHDFCGYDPANPATDQGGIEQDVLADWMNKGVPVRAGVNSLSAFFEVDPRNLDDVMAAIADCGILYVGFNVPAFIMAGGNPPSTWDVPAEGQDASNEGGHCVVACGYDSSTVTVISWGKTYKMTWAFFRAFVDECYALVDSEWINATGKSPMGMSLGELEAQMSAIRRA
jgi:hypothetical protein